MDKDVLLSIRRISKEFPGVKALNNVSFDIRRGEVHAVVGENGAGKSTLMNILSGLYQPATGVIVFEDKVLNIRDPKQSQDVGISMIHQELSLANHLSVMENIYLGKMKRNSFGFINYKQVYKMCQQQLDCIGQLDILPDMLVKDLSVSQMQLVEIAKALSIKSKLIIMDEPTSSITAKETEMLFSIIRSLKEKGVSILYISHRFEEIFGISDRVTVLRDGNHIITDLISKITPKELVSYMVGREFNNLFHRDYKNVSVDEKPILEAKNLGCEKKISNINFKLFKGEILAITGLVGSGRTEVLQCIFGLLKNTHGEIIFEGVPIKIKSPIEAIQLGIGMVPEGRKLNGLFLGMNIRENITIANLPRICKFNFIKRNIEKLEAEKYIKELKIKTVNSEQKIKYLSGGNQQKAIISRWLSTKPKVLFLDEPTHGVDVAAKAEIYEIINNLANEGVSIVLVSSELPEVLTLADKIIVMHNGCITGNILHAQATQSLIMEYATNQFVCVTN